MRTLVISALVCGNVHLGWGQQLDLEQVFDERNLLPVAQLLEGGDYELVSRITDLAIQRGQKSVEWRSLRLRSLREMGLIGQAVDESAKYTGAASEDLPLLMLRRDLALSLGKKDESKALLDQFNKLANCGGNGCHGKSCRGSGLGCAKSAGSVF